MKVNNRFFERVGLPREGGYWYAFQGTFHRGGIRCRLLIDQDHDLESLRFEPGDELIPYPEE